MKIKDLCADERPREKMLGKGASALSNAELLAILLRTGTEGRNALEVAQILLSAAGGSLTAASRMSVSELCRIDGIGTGKAVTIGAALELGKRPARGMLDTLPFQKQQGDIQGAAECRRTERDHC